MNEGPSSRPHWSGSCAWSLRAVRAVRAPGPGAATPAEASPPARTLVAAVASEPGSLAQLPLVTEGASFAGLNTVQAFANANLLLKDDQIAVRPYLAEAAPQLNTGLLAGVPGRPHGDDLEAQALA